jgi:hypothetical protein
VVEAVEQFPRKPVILMEPLGEPRAFSTSAPVRQPRPSITCYEHGLVDRSQLTTEFLR